MKRNKRKKLAAVAQMNLEADRSLTFDTLTKPLGIGVVTDGVAATTLTGAPSVQHVSPTVPQGVESPHPHSGVYEFEGFSSGDESPSPVGATFRVLSLSLCFFLFVSWCALCLGAFCVWCVLRVWCVGRSLALSLSSVSSKFPCLSSLYH